MRFGRLLAGMAVLLLLGWGLSTWHNAQQQRLNVPAGLPAFADDTLITVGFYNLENLFDTINDPGVRDGSFTPQGDKQWNHRRYQTKLRRLARAIRAMNKHQAPDLLGMCEVENRGVLKDLTAMPRLKDRGFKIIHEDSPDERGIDVAMLYKPDRFHPLYYRTIPVHMEAAPEDRTRDILYVKGTLASGDTLHCFWNHWSSRWGGKARTRFKRVAAARIVRRYVDSLTSGRAGVKILIGGDLNDNPDNQSVREVLGASCTQGSTLWNPMCRLFDTHPLGTQRYKDYWNVYDQLIISKGLLSGGTCQYKLGSARIFTPEWLTQQHPRQEGVVAYRTYRGDYYNGGYSDHFPVLLDLVLDP